MDTGFRIVRPHPFIPSPADPEWDGKTFPTAFLEFAQSVAMELNLVCEDLEGAPPTEADDEAVGDVIQSLITINEAFAMFRRIIAGMDRAAEVVINGEKVVLLGPVESFDIGVALMTGIGSVSKEDVTKLVADVLMKRLEEEVDDDEDDGFRSGQYL